MKDIRKNSTKARTSAAVAVALTVVIIAVLAMGVMLAQQNGYFSFSHPNTSTTINQAQQQVTNSQSASNAQKWEALVTDKIAGGSVSASVDSFTLGSCSSGSSCYNPTAESSTVTSGLWGPTTLPYAPGSLLVEATASGYYPSYILDSNPQSILCTSCNQQNVYYYLEQMPLIQAPASGTSATTDVAATLGGSGGNAAPSSLSTTFAGVTAVLNIEQASRGIASNFPVYGTASQAVTVYSGSTSVQSYSGVIYPELVGIACANSTSLQFQATGSTTLTPMSGSGINTADSCVYFAISSSVLGNAQTSATNPTSVSIPFQIETSASTGHTALTIIFLDNQETGWISGHFTTPGATSFPAAGAAAGLPSGFSGVTPSSNGVPALTVEQSYTAIFVN
ncbi:MAG: hypothetical protein ACYCQJ_12955 [Nitrososphaerales archaeon]